MIMMEQPSVVFQAFDVDADYKMQYTINLHQGATANYVVDKIIDIHQRTPLRNIIFNAHGNSTKVAIGGKEINQPGIEPSTLSAFARLHSLNVGTIWITSCNAATGQSGQSFCQSFAVTAGTQVIAGAALQEVGPWDWWRLKAPFFQDGQIDDFEGAVFSFTPKGGSRLIVFGDVDGSDYIWTIKT